MLTALTSTTAHAHPYINPDDRLLRADLQYLVDSGVAEVPLTTWPLPREQLRPLVEADVSDQPAAVQAAHNRVVSRITQPSRAELTARVASDPDPRTYFSDVPIHEQELEAAVNLGSSSERWGGRIQANAHRHDRDDASTKTETYLDGSYAAVRLGNWLVHGGAQDRWWGPGSEGSLILTDNARPVPSVGFDRVAAEPFDLPVLRWLGPWNLTTFLGELDGDRKDAPYAKLFGMRVAFRPYSGLEIGLSRTAQWGGEGRPEDLNSFWRMFTGQSNIGDDPDNEPEGGHANQFAGWDLRWASPLGTAPYAIYMQLIGIDEAGNYLSWPYQNMGLAGIETWWAGAGGNRYRWHFEAADTATNFWREEGPSSDRSARNYNNAYTHSFYEDGYRYHDRVQGHSMDSGGQMFSTGLQLVEPKGYYWELLVRYTQQNRGGRDDTDRDVKRRAPAVMEQADFLVIDITRGLHYGPLTIELNLGAEQKAPAEGERELEMRGWTRVSWDLF
ncbi:capsule assembly Wzi family protein [Halorhodospira halochloris]|uniref:capsule assembly Wzi family protein n=1 Tax=Halorhodospira halochloris TaxID=1052 RepID=UPI001EE96E6C|nr:capsule assembly Wzi family protein [Halorhodospira halochloris]